MEIGRVLLRFMLIAAFSTGLYAQDSYEKVNSHFGAIAGFPLSAMGTYTSIGAGLHGGGGYNFSKHHSEITEFMWTRLSVTGAALLPLQQASGQASLTGHSNLYVVTENYRYERRGKTFGTYFIVGGGLYYRTTNPSLVIHSGNNTPCTKAWQWWGFKCSSGLVVPDQEMGSTGSNAFGGNIGLGFTSRIGEEPYRFYIESRYHYALHTNINTQLITIGVGIRY